jgi:ATP:corrinoid adenosyltransferase
MKISEFLNPGISASSPFAFFTLTKHLLFPNSIIGLLRQKPEDLHIAITGRDAPNELLDIADLVTEMSAVKHPYKSGVRGQMGVEF